MTSWGREFTLVDGDYKAGLIEDVGFEIAIEIYGIAKDGHRNVKDGLDDLIDGGNGGCWDPSCARICWSGYWEFIYEVR